MAYTINLTDGTVFATIADGTINTDSSMTLIGKNYAGYGEFLDENFIKLLENSSNTTAPGAPLTGQLWWDKANAVLKVYNGSTFKVISASTASATAPSNNVTGDLWFDTTNQQLKVYNGTSFILVGPAFTAGTGTTGAIVDTITDTLAVSHVVIKLFVEDDIVGIISKDASFTPAASISGFTTVRPGITLATTVGAQTPLFQGTSQDSQTLDTLDSTQFLRSDENDTTTGTLGVLNDNGFAVGADQDFRVTVSGTAVALTNQTQDGNILIRVNDGGVTTTVMTIDGSTSIATVNTSLSVTGNVTGGNLVTTGTGNISTVSSTTITATGNITGGNLITAGLVSTTSITKTGSNAVGNIGSSSNYFNRVFATASTALYADVAERFAADEPLLPGTVVELGGAAEITTAREDLTDKVFGVISSNAAYLMNGGAGDDDTHPPVAMTGRVPVRVVGPIRKGDRLVSAGRGLARAALPGEANSFNTLGRALVDKLEEGEGMVESIVTIH